MVLAAVAAAVVTAGCAPGTTTGGGGAASVGPARPTSMPPADPATTAAVVRTIESAMARNHLRAVIAKVSVDGREVLTRAFGESMTGVPATTDMHFRNGAVAISYVSTLLLRLVDEGRVRLDDRVSTWLPEIPHADEVTLGQLAQMTSGYPDYVIGNAPFAAALYADPYRQWTPEELLGHATGKPLIYSPGTNWNYAHTNYVILGLALERITGRPMREVLKEKVLAPLGLDDTTDPGTPAIPEPALHAFSSERREALGIPAATPFYEESTYWNPSWTITHGAIQTTTIEDLHDTAVGIGTGRLLSERSYQAMVSTDLRGRTTALPGCTTCLPQQVGYSYGLGIVTSGDWLVQNPLFSGESGAFAYLPSGRVAIALAVTYGEKAFDPVTGAYPNQADALWREIGAVLAPADPPPTSRR